MLAAEMAFTGVDRCDCRFNVRCFSFGLHGCFFVVGGVGKCDALVMSNDPKPEERMRRMREMFAKDLTILAEDYEHFSGVSLGASSRRNKGSRRSAASNEPLDPERN